jgi:glutaredoxin
MSLRKWLLIGALMIGAWNGYKISQQHHGGIERIGASITDNVNEEQLKLLALNVKQGEVLIYTTTDCPYCAQAKAWMTQYGFAYTECNADTSSTCESELNALGSDGVPYLVVRGHHMKEGFDSDEFVDALRT